MKSYTTNQNKGFTILFSLVVISLLMGTALAISSLTQKRLILSSIGKQSQIAFYAADSGVECARFWDTRGEAFGTSTRSILCNGQSFTVGGESDEGGNEVISEFKMLIPSSAGETPTYTYCADVTVTKNLDIGDTTILSRGYNTRCDAVTSRKVERAILVNY